MRFTVRVFPKKYPVIESQTSVCIGTPEVVKSLTMPFVIAHTSTLGVAGRALEVWLNTNAVEPGIAAAGRELKQTAKRKARVKANSDFIRRSFKLSFSGIVCPAPATMLHGVTSPLQRGESAFMVGMFLK